MGLVGGAQELYLVRGWDRWWDRVGYNSPSLPLPFSSSPSLCVQATLELLDYHYSDEKVRSMAVKRLEGMSDDELVEILLQLVQVRGEGGEGRGREGRGEGGKGSEGRGGCC